MTKPCRCDLGRLPVLSAQHTHQQMVHKKRKGKLLTTEARIPGWMASHGARAEGNAARPDPFPRRPRGTNFHAHRAAHPGSAPPLHAANCPVVSCVCQAFNR